MATGRTVARWTRVYVDGYDMSGMARSIGPLESVYEEIDMTTLGDSVKNYLPGHPSLNIGVFNAVFDNTADVGTHTVLQTTGNRTVLVVKGIRAEPAIGDPCFGGEFLQSAYAALSEDGVFVNIPFAGWAADANHKQYPVAWGQLLHTNTLADDVNADDAGVQSPTAAATTHGGFMIYHVTAATGGAGVTATIKVQHSVDEDDAHYADLGGCTTGVIDVGTAPVAGVIPTTLNTTTVNEFLRWQIVLGTATDVTFVLAFVRGIA